MGRNRVGFSQHRGSRELLFNVLFDLREGASAQKGFCFLRVPSTSIVRDLKTLTCDFFWHLQVSGNQLRAINDQYLLQCQLIRHDC